MGDAIRHQETVEGHQALSLALDTFARAVPRKVEIDHRGELIYAGGDDVLAFVPLHRVLDCAQALAQDFSQRLARFPTGPEGRPPTLSVGIGICHFLDPMGGALQVARRAERRAKTLRNALAVIVDKRSGPEIEALGTWGTVDQDLAHFVSLHVHDWVPDGAAYELRELARLLDGAEGQERRSLEELVRQEAERILRRKQPQHGDAARLSEEVLTGLLAGLDLRGVGLLADLLILARTLAQATEEANPSPADSGGATP
jgi:CRISPR-associated protein Cmr2